MTFVEEKTYQRRYCGVGDLKKGMEIGSPNKLLYTIVEDARVTSIGTIAAEIEFADGRRETREWLYSQATVAVRALS